MPQSTPNKPPSNFETYQTAKSRRKKRIRSLSRGGRELRSLIHKLGKCTKMLRCHSEIDPICLGNFRLRLYRGLKSIIQSRKHWMRVSVITKGLLFKRGTLQSADLPKLIKSLRKRLERSSLQDRMIIGGIDVSLNFGEDHVVGWQLHLYLLIEGSDDDVHLREAIKAAFPGEPTAVKPYDFTPMYEFGGAITYLYKTEFSRRITYFEDDKRKTDDPRLGVANFANSPCGWGNIK
jgi:hypothetical protein